MKVALSIRNSQVESFVAASAMSQFRDILESLDGVELVPDPEPFGRPRAAVAELVVVASGVGATYQALRYGRAVLAEFGMSLTATLTSDDPTEHAAFDATVRRLDQEHADGDRS